MKRSVTYYTHAHNIEGCLRNGSFVRVWSDGRIVQYMNGDCMGTIEKIPASMTKVSEDLAKRLLPQCCR